MRPRIAGAIVLAAGGCTVAFTADQAAAPVRPQSAELRASATIGVSECTASRLGTSIPAKSIGEPVRAVALSEPRWIEASGSTPGYCSIDGAMAPVDQSPNAPPITFRVVLPASWTGRTVQLGGGGMNGVIPNLTGGRGGPGPTQGVATYGSDSGHRADAAPDWTLNDEAIRNLGYLQMKKTHDAAMVIIERAYAQRPRFNYYVGTSQGGREALTVAAS